MLALWSVLALGLSASEQTRLREALLGGETPPDPAVPPSTSDGNGTRVSVQLRIFKVLNVDIASGELKLKVWRRMVWYDDRLKWDPAEYDGIETFRAYPHDGRQLGKDDSLWLPSVYMTNTIEREADTLEVGGAWVRFDGRVWHSIPGTIELSCRFTGLAKFPTDTLSCPMEISSWTYADPVVKLTYFDSDLAWGWPNDTEAAGRVWTEVTRSHSNSPAGPGCPPVTSTLHCCRWARVGRGKARSCTTRSWRPHYGARSRRSGPCQGNLAKPSDSTSLTGTQQKPIWRAMRSAVTSSRWMEIISGLTIHFHALSWGHSLEHPVPPTMNLSSSASSASRTRALIPWVLWGPVVGKLSGSKLKEYGPLNEW